MPTGLESLADKTVLVVDDNRAFLRLMRSILTDFGVKDVVDFDHAAPVISYLESHHVSALFLDLVMPGQNGLALAQEIRHAPKLRNRTMPIIMVTGHADVGNLQAAIHAGVDEMLVKPVRPRDLRDKLLAVIHQPRIYIKTRSGYFGPDRRRRQDPLYRGPERRLRNDFEVVTRELPSAPMPGADTNRAGRGDAFPTGLKAMPPSATPTKDEGLPLAMSPVVRSNDAATVAWSAPQAAISAPQDGFMKDVTPTIHQGDATEPPSAVGKRTSERPIRSMGGPRFFLD